MHDFLQVPLLPDNDKINWEGKKKKLPRVQNTAKISPADGKHLSSSDLISSDFFSEEVAFLLPLQSPKGSTPPRPHSLKMGHEVLIGGSCYTASTAQKLIDRINDKSGPAVVLRISGQWVYFVEFESNVDAVKELVQATSLSAQTSSSHASGGDAQSIKIYITPRTTPSPWSSQATNIAQVCGVKARIERGRFVTIEFEGAAPADVAAFRDVLHDRMTESITETLPEPATIFAEGARQSLVVVDIFADERGPLAALQDYNKKMGLGLDQPNMEYLVDQYKSLGRSPVRIAVRLSLSLRIFLLLLLLSLLHLFSRRVSCLLAEKFFW